MYTAQPTAYTERFRAVVKTSLQAAFGPRLRGILLYGSQARGEATEESDLDLMVLLDGPIDLGGDLRIIVQALYPLQLEIERPIHAVPASLSSFEAGEFSLYRRVKAEGVRL